MHRDEDEREHAAEGGAARPSRAVQKRERASNDAALGELVQALRSLNPAQLRAVAVPEPVFAALMAANNIKSFSALERHLRHTRALLRGSEWLPLVRRVDLIRAGFAVGEDDETSPAVVWTNRLLVHGDPALARFLEEFPAADRRRMRQFVRNVKRAAEDRRAKARRLLEGAVRSVMQHAESEQRRATAAGPAPTATASRIAADDGED